MVELKSIITVNTTMMNTVTSSSKSPKEKRRNELLNIEHDMY